MAVHCTSAKFNFKENCLAGILLVISCSSWLLSSDGLHQVEVLLKQVHTYIILCLLSIWIIGTSTHACPCISTREKEVGFLHY